MKNEMKIVTTTSVFPRGYSAEKALERIAAAGFDALDMALDYWDYGPDSPFMGGGYLRWAAGLRELAAALGVEYTHSHAPGGADTPELIERSVGTAAALGAAFMVVHPIYRRADGADLDDPEEFVRLNAEAIAPWLEEARKRGITVLTENLLDGASRDPRNVAELVREVGADNFGWCYDTGHAHCTGHAPDVLTRCAVAPLSLHLQDNDASGDEHLMPGDGTVDWSAVATALKGVGYRGDCVLEAHHQIKAAPDAERDDLLVRLLERARPLRDLLCN